jgi:hypothetical protein
MPPPTELLNLTEKCNQNCVFCGAEGAIKAQSQREVNAIIRRAGGNLTISGWEPTLHPGLAGIVRGAKKAGLKNITLFTNAVLLDDAAYVRRLIAAGVRTFHVNFPSHDKKLSDLLTGVPGSFKRRLAGVRNILAAPGRKYVSLVFVINSLNYRTMPEYARYVTENFPGLVHVLLTAVCAAGRAAENPSLVPRLNKITPYLAKAQAVFLERRVKCLVENVPLCLLPGAEHASFDARNALLTGSAAVLGKARRRECGGCSLKPLCPGLRDDYFNLYGSKELLPSARRPETVARAVELLQAARL